MQTHQHHIIHILYKTYCLRALRPNQKIYDQMNERLLPIQSAIFLIPFNRRRRRNLNLKKKNKEKSPIFKLVKWKCLACSPALEHSTGARCWCTARNEDEGSE